MKQIDNYWVPENDTFSENIIAEARRHYYAFAKYVKEWDIAIDVGAHVGTWTTKMAKDFRKVYAFEASFMNYTCLIENTKSYAIVNAVNVAVGAEPGRCFSVPNAHSRKGNTGARHIKQTPLGLVEVMPLDDAWIDGVTGLIKIDVEGFEEEVLIGAEKLIKMHHPAIIVERNKTAELNYGKDKNAPQHILADWGYNRAIVLNKDWMYLYD